MTHALPIWTISGPRPGSFKWAAHLALVVLLSVALVTVGCGFASFVAAAETDIPVVIQMVTNITNVAAPGVSLQIQAYGVLALASLHILCGTPAIGASKCDPTSLVGQYQSSTDAIAKASILQKIQAALASVNAQLGNIIELAKGIPTSAAAAIATGVGIALSTVTLLLSLAPVASKGAFNSAKKAGTIRWPEKPSKLKADFNTAVAAQFPGAVVH